MDFILAVAIGIRDEGTKEDLTEVKNKIKAPPFG